jgi:hypothetical protein
VKRSATLGLVASSALAAPRRRPVKLHGGKDRDFTSASVSVPARGTVSVRIQLGSRREPGPE